MKNSIESVIARGLIGGLIGVAVSEGVKAFQQQWTKGFDEGYELAVGERRSLIGPEDEDIDLGLIGNQEPPYSDYWFTKGYEHAMEKATEATERVSQDIQETLADVTSILDRIEIQNAEEKATNDFAESLKNLNEEAFESLVVGVTGDQNGEVTMAFVNEAIRRAQENDESIRDAVVQVAQWISAVPYGHEYDMAVEEALDLANDQQATVHQIHVD